jgi:hypothetical protein
VISPPPVPTFCPPPPVPASYRHLQSLFQFFSSQWPFATISFIITTSARQFRVAYSSLVDFLKLPAAAAAASERHPVPALDILLCRGDAFGSVSEAGSGTGPETGAAEGAGVGAALTVEAIRNASSTVLTKKEGDWLYRHGDTADVVYVLLQGEAEAFVPFAESDEAQGGGRGVQLRRGGRSGRSGRAINGLGALPTSRGMVSRPSAVSLALSPPGRLSRNDYLGGGGGWDWRGVDGVAGGGVEGTGIGTGLGGGGVEVEEGEWGGALGVGSLAGGLACFVRTSHREGVRCSSDCTWAVFPMRLFETAAKIGATAGASATSTSEGEGTTSTFTGHQVRVLLALSLEIGSAFTPLLRLFLGLGLKRRWLRAGELLFEKGVCEVGSKGVGKCCRFSVDCAGAGAGASAGASARAGADGAAGAGAFSFFSFPLLTSLPSSSQAMLLTGCSSLFQEDCAD